MSLKKALISAVLFYCRLCPSTAGSSPPPESSNFLCPLLSLSKPLLFPHIVSPTTFWSSSWPYTLYLLLCASNSPSIIFHLGDVSSPFPFCICHVSRVSDQNGWNIPFWLETLWYWTMCADITDINYCCHHIHKAWDFIGTVTNLSSVP